MVLYTSPISINLSSILRISPAGAEAKRSHSSLIVRPAGLSEEVDWRYSTTSASLRAGATGAAGAADVICALAVCVDDGILADTVATLTFMGDATKFTAS